MNQPDIFPITCDGQPLDMLQLRLWAAFPTDAEPVELAKDWLTFEQYAESMIDVSARRPGKLVVQPVDEGQILESYELPEVTTLGIINDANVIVGAIGIGISKTERIAKLFGVFCVPELEGHGIARKLIAGALAQLLKQGIDVAWLEVVDSNTRARDLYRYAGFVSSSAINRMFGTRDGATAMLLAGREDVEHSIAKLRGKS